MDTLHISPADLEAKIVELGVELLSNDHPALEQEMKAWTTAEDDYRYAKAVAYLAATGTVNERSAHVDKACDSERRAAHTAEALQEARKELIRSKRQVLSSLQSLLSAQKAEMQMTAGKAYGS